MAALATVATVAAGAAAVVGAGAQIYGGYAQQQSDDAARKAQALQYEEQGRAEFAAAQRQAIERRLQGQIALSDQQAAAAASGGGAGTNAPTIVRLMTETSQRADYGAASEQYSGAQSQRNYNTAASNVLASKSNSFLGSLLSGIGTLAGGAASTYNMADRFNLLPKSAPNTWGFNSPWVTA
jgi:hypothetical protein